MRIVVAGDVIFGSGGLAARLPEEIKAVLGDADATFVNAEFVCPRVETPPLPRKFPIGVGSWALDELASIGVNLVSAANNHSADFGPAGVVDTIEAYEARRLTFAGIGRTLVDARAPAFLDTSVGRVGLVAASSTRSREAMAGSLGRYMAARPGLNPLRWDQAYVLPAEQYEQLRCIDEMLGTAGAHRETHRVEVWEESDDAFDFGPVFEGHVRIERGSSAEVRFGAVDEDVEAIVVAVRDAAERSDCVVASLHCHEGVGDGWYADRAAGFIEEVARRTIDAGASMFAGHGPHMLRGIEFYKGRPIFYSLGSLIMEFEMSERLTPEVYAGYGLPSSAQPSDLHRGRARTDRGRPQGFYAEERFSRSVVAVCDVADDRTDVRLVPLGLRLNADSPSERGLPAPPCPEEAAAISAEMARMSAPYGTVIEFDERTGVSYAFAG